MTVLKNVLKYRIWELVKERHEGHKCRQMPRQHHRRKKNFVYQCAKMVRKNGVTVMVNAIDWMAALLLSRRMVLRGGIMMVCCTAWAARRLSGLMGMRSGIRM